MAETTTLDQSTQAKASLQKHGKSFAWAARFLGADHADRGARLYAICRAIDDMADDNTPQRASALLSGLRTALATGKSAEPEAVDLAAQVARLDQMIGLSHQALTHLIDGVEQDLEPVRIADQDALIRYAYRVAGTVGLMMCDVLGVQNPLAKRHAVDMGIAMQLTNIARDVLEDARLDRRYIPGTWLAAEPDRLIDPDAETVAAAQQAIARLLDLADRYYTSGRAGLPYLPFRPRLAIAIAAAVYRAIGDRLRQRGYDYRQGRVVVPSLQKAVISASIIANPKILSRARTKHGHDSELQRALDDLMGPNETADHAPA